ncbi:MAG: SNF2-related protein [Imperialibacter sp.]|uniref:SNF2-related protein n=1 Tax=Imperialibacter sp. TaxID=2038411 RepID=UPI0032ECF52F
MDNSNWTDSIQGFLDFEKPKWPKQSVFPLNVPDQNRKVGNVLEGDLSESTECIIITGFTSLIRIIEWFGTDKFPNLRAIKILLGNDPIVRKRNKYPFGYIDLNLRDYWIQKGVSLYLGSSVLNVIERIERGDINIKFKKRAHAKIYVGKHHALLGSSNFSKSGLEDQIEANIRESAEGKYEEIKGLAELIYHEGAQHNEEIVSLLKELLADVTWQEALARAIAEVLEGRWFSDNNDFFEKLSSKKFWPTQYEGLIEAINILIDKGNVLIADPTGSGKTKMCSAIIISFIYWLWQIGEKFSSNLLIFSPPIVKSNWEQELRSLDFLNYTFRSLGILSNASEDNLKDILTELSLANLLVVDEAHNLLNPISKRSKKLASNKADYKILITATPVNKRLEDLLRMIELLDVDNLSDEDFDFFKEIKENRFEAANKDERDRLKGFIDNFLVRRTKTELNQIIFRDPDKYRNKAGRKCRFPDAENPVYNTGETNKDKIIAEDISVLATKLRGVNFLTHFEPAHYLVNNEKDKDRYIKQRLEAAKSLAIYNIRACLRSSKPALIEYLQGTEKAKTDYDLDTNKDLTGNVVETITQLIDKLPEKNFISNSFPSWLLNQEEYNQACKEEISIYQDIISQLNEMSSQRERSKVGEIRGLLKTHNIVIAFDSKLITLDYLNSILLEEDSSIKTYIATGSNKTIVEKVLRVCELGSSHKNTVVFCSDKMSEGVNLQAASALVLLDLPSVVRLIEQRIGRIDRMDTNHDVINILWPNDSDEFSLKGDRRLINTAVFVDATIGGNFELPSELRDKHFQNVDSIETIKKELEENKGEKGWEGSHNFFKPIQDLKSSLLDDEVYFQVKDVQAQVKTRVSFYQSDTDWCFICTRGSIKESPKWLFLEKNKAPINNFIGVASKLSTYLPFVESERLAWNQTILDAFLKDFRERERYLLPEKKKRALDVVKFILTQREHKTRKPLNKKVNQLIRRNLSLLNPSIKGEITDYHALADLWIQFLQKYLDKKRDRRGNRRKAFNLNSLKEDWNKINIPVGVLQHILDNCAKTESIDNKIAACIIGVSRGSNKG